MQRNVLQKPTAMCKCKTSVQMAKVRGETEGKTFPAYWEPNKVNPSAFGMANEFHYLRASVYRCIQTKASLTMAPKTVKRH